MLQTGSKRKRTKQQIEDEKQANFIKEQQIAAKLDNYEILQQKVQMMEQEAQSGKLAANLMTQLIHAGLIEQSAEDEFTVHGSQGDQQFKPFDQE